MIHGPKETVPPNPMDLIDDFPDLVWRAQPQHVDMAWPMFAGDDGRPEPSWWPPKAWRTEPA